MAKVVSPNFKFSNLKPQIFKSSNFKLQTSNPQTSNLQTFIMYSIPFTTLDWSSIEKTEHKGTTGTSFWQTIDLNGLRIRIVEYSANYLADHWCQKGHVVHCLEGSFVTEMQTGEKITLTPGMSYVVSDELSSHRSTSAKGVKLLIVDGEFLKGK